MKRSIVTNLAAGGLVLGLLWTAVAEPPRCLHDPGAAACVPHTHERPTLWTVSSGSGPSRPPMFAVPGW